MSSMDLVMRSWLTLVRCIKPCGHDAARSFSRIIFKRHRKVMDDEKRNPIDFGSWIQRSRATLAPCEGMPRLALSNYY